MLSFGWNLNYQLGHPDNEPRIVPQHVEHFRDKKIRSVVCGSRYTVAVTSHGNVFTWGKGDDGQLGHGGFSVQKLPRMVQYFEGIRIVSVAARGSHTLALSEEGFLYSWGRGDEGQLGLGDMNSYNKPCLVKSLCEKNIRVKEIGCGRIHSAAITVNGELYTWGCSDEGATGQGTYEESFLLPTLVENLHDVGDIACGSRHSLLILGSGRVFAMGWNVYGQLGTGDQKNRNLPSEVFFPTRVENTSFIQTSGSSGSALNSSFSNSSMKVVQVSCGYRHSLAIVEYPDGSRELYTWGWNQYNQLGIYSESKVVVLPHIVDEVEHFVYRVAGGGRHSLAIFQRDDGAKRLYSWGRGDDGQLGNGTRNRVMTPERVLSCGEDVELVAGGWSHSVCTVSGSLSPSADLSASRTKLITGMRTPSLPFRAGARSGSTLWQRVGQIWEMLSFGNIDAGFAQLLNALILFLLILTSLHLRAGFDEAVVIGQVLPGAACTVFVSNIVFGLWADYLTRSSKDVNQLTALPHGINTVVFFAFSVLIITPEYQRTRDPIIAYHTGLGACFILGLLELPCVLFVDHLRRAIPRAAMMSALAGVSLTFISMTFAVEIYSKPIVGIMPLIIILVCYGSNVQLPYKIPSGLAALILGTILAWSAKYFLDMDTFDINVAPKGSSWHFLPRISVSNVFSAVFDPRTWPYVTTVVIPMLMVNLVTNMSCVESASAVGDEYSIRKALTMDALLTMFGALIGNPFPTCFYIGHGAFKGMGAKTVYSYINAVSVLILGVFNGAYWISQFVPQVGGVGLLMWIGIVVTAQAFDRDESQDERSHAAAVALGLVPALAAWCLQHVEAVVTTCSDILKAGVEDLPFDMIVQRLEENGVLIYGLISLSRGYLLSSIYLSSALVNIIERQFARAAMWLLVASVLSFIGVVHSFHISEHGISSTYGFPARSPENYALQYSVAYAGAALVLLIFEVRESDEGWSYYLSKLFSILRKVSHPYLHRQKSKPSENRPLVIPNVPKYT